MIHFGRGPAAAGGSQTHQRDGSVEAQRWVFARSKFPGRNWFPLGFWLGDGRGRWRWRAPLFPTKLSSVVWGLSNSPSLCPPAFPLSEQSCYLMTSQMLSPACYRNTLHLAPQLLQARLRGSAWPAGCPSTPAPSRQSVQQEMPLHPSYPLLWASRLRLALETLLVFWQFSGLFRQV